MIDLLDPQLHASDVVDVALARLRAESPVAWCQGRRGPGYWSITGHPELLVAARATQTFSSHWGTRPEVKRADHARRPLHSLDPPAHTELRAIAARLVDRDLPIAAIVDDALAAFVRQMRAENVRSSEIEMGPGPFSTLGVRHADRTAAKGGDAMSMVDGGDATSMIAAHGGVEMGPGGVEMGPGPFSTLGVRHADRRDVETEFEMGPGPFSTVGVRHADRTAAKGGDATSMIAAHSGDAMSMVDATSMIAAHGCDAMWMLAEPIASRVIAALLDVDVDDVDVDAGELLACVRAVHADGFALVDTAAGDPARAEIAERARAAEAALHRLVARGSARHPYMDIDDRVGVAMLFAEALPTLIDAIGNSLVDLVTHPPVEATDLLVEELLRRASPNAQFARYATRSAILGGQTIREGDQVVLWFCAANRDPRVFRDPERLVADRAPNPHVAFGFGPHYCIGAQIARRVVRALVSALVAAPVRFVAAGAFERRASNYLRGYTRIPLALRELP